MIKEGTFSPCSVSPFLPTLKYQNFNYNWVSTTCDHQTLVREPYDLAKICFAMEQRKKLVQNKR